jgi:centrosomal protein CEP76
MALTNYEQERVIGQTFGNEEFQNAIRKRVPENHTFKAFPIQFIQKNSSQIFDILVNAQVFYFFLCIIKIKK